MSAAYLCPPPAPPPHAARVRADAPAQRRVRETEAARTVRSWGIASMLREVGHLLSLAEFEDKLANAISTKYSSRDLSPSSKRTAGCWSGLVRIVWVCHQRASALRDELLSPRPLFSFAYIFDVKNNIQQGPLLEVQSDQALALQNALELNLSSQPFRSKKFGG